MLLSDYYLYFLITSVSSSYADDTGWCSVHEVFSSFVHTEFTREGQYLYFDYEFGKDIPCIGTELLKSGDKDLINTVFRFLFSLQEQTGVQLMCKHNMKSVWMGFGIELDFSISINRKSCITILSNNSCKTVSNHSGQLV